MSTLNWSPNCDKNLHFLVFYSKRPSILIPKATFIGSFKGQVNHISSGHQCNGGTIRTFMINSSDAEMNGMAHDIKQSPNIVVVSVTSNDGMAIVMGESGGAFVFGQGSVLKVKTTSITTKIGDNETQKAINGVYGLTVTSRYRVVIVITHSEELLMICQTDNDYTIEPLVDDMNRSETDDSLYSSQKLSFPRDESPNERKFTNQLLRSELNEESGSSDGANGAEIYDYQPVPERLCRSGRFVPLFRDNNY